MSENSIMTIEETLATITEVQEARNVRLLFELPLDAMLLDLEPGW